ncbi:hypothetical protein [Mesorhizobium sp. BHbdii]
MHFQQWAFEAGQGKLRNPLFSLVKFESNIFMIAKRDFSCDVAITSGATSRADGRQMGSGTPVD